MKPLIYILFLTVRVSDGVIYRLNDTEYLRMPPIHHLDDYESCLHQTNGTYCYVVMDLVSDTPSDLLQMIREYSKHTNHFNHMRLHHGICLTKTCKNYLQQSKAMDTRLVLERCLNESLWRDYNLKTKVTDMTNCKKLNDSTITNINTGDICAAVFFVCLALFNVIGSLYDFYFIKGDKGHRFFLSFSLKRNLKKLISRDKDPLRERLQGIHGIRALSVMLIIMGHAPLPFIMTSENPHGFEQTYYNIAYQLFYNGTIIVQTFFIMAGVLVAYNIRTYFGNELNWTLIPKGILLRWFRLTPAYAVVMIFTLTWMRFLGSGPLWEQAVDVEVGDCHRDGWLNMIYLNNYIDNSQCMAQTWYLAADMQLYTLSLFVCVLTKSARSRNIVLIILLIIGIMLPAVHTYLQDLDAIMIIGPEISTNLFVTYPTFNHSYKRGHTNIPSTVLGLAAGNLIYEGLKDEKKIMKFKKLGILYYLTVPMGIMLTLSGMVFYRDQPRVPIYVRVIVAAFFRPLYALITVIFAIGVVFKFENVYRTIVEWRGWRTLARVSYSAYLIHVTIIRIFAGMNRTLLHTGLAVCFKEAFGILFITNIIAYPFWLFVEAPLNQAILFVLGLSKGDKKDGNNQNIDSISRRNTRGAVEESGDNKGTETNSIV